MTSHAVNPAPHRPPNRLAKEASPYLLQHAYNPVDWRPWGDEAFAEARRRDVPILLSIGYSTCYWCHVMERESFEDDAIAHQMNEHFVCVKVDREERPDVDDLYMNATLAMTGRGGWPMTVFLDPASLKPFWCGTYFPPRAHHGLPGLPQVLDGVSQAWRTQREAVLAQANQLADAVNEHLAVKFGGAKVTRRHLQSAVEALLQIADRTEGGFGREPKFPQPIFLEYLIDIRAVAGDEQTADAVDIVLKRTLDAMAVGGIFDHVGGGFHRYSVDATWTVPHFEKMLYDNAQLAAVYARAARLYSDAFYARVAIKTLEFVERELTGPAGEFLSALDAEVDAREGLNYLWTPAQVREAVGDANEHQDADLAIAMYGLDRGPNFRDPHHPSEPPSNILRLDTRPERIAARLNLHIDTLFAKLDSVNAALLAARSKRTQPHLDDKAIAGWNGLMISAFARAAESLDDPRWLDSAKRAARFAASAHDRRLFDGAALARSWRAGARGPEGTLEDYALLAHGLLDLARAVPRDDAAEFLTAATSLLTSARAAFRTPEGRWFDTRAGRSDLFIRSASTHDGVIPSGLSAAAHAYSLHYELTGYDVSLTAAAELLQCIAPALSESPTSCAHALRLILRAMTTPQLAAIVAPILGDTADTASSAAADAGSPEPSPSFLPVEVYAAVDRVTVGPDQPASLTLVLKIADGYHITAADPIPPHARAAGINEAQVIEQALFPLRVGVAHGRGVAAYADYPVGSTMGIAGREVMVHTGTIELPVALEYTGSWSGRPIITLSYQACTDRECLLPRTVELDVAIDRA